MVKLKLLSESFSLQSVSKRARVYPFTATVTHGGKASERCVGGTDLIAGGPYRVIVPNVLLKAKIEDLVGKGVFASEELDTHSNSVCIGEFSQAWVEEDDDGQCRAKASGFIFSDRDPKLVEQVIEQARAGKLGFSYDLKSVQSKREDLQIGAGNSMEQVLVLSDFQWRGATILFKEAAAYEETQLAAQKLNSQKEQIDMDAKELKELFAQALQPVVEDLKKEIGGVRTEMNDKFKTLEAAKPPEKKAEEKDEKKGDLAAGISMTDFMKGIGDAMKAAVTEVVKPLQDSLEAQKKEGEKKGVRRTLSAADVEFHGKWTDKKEGDTLEVADVQKKIDEIKASASLTPSQKARQLEALSAEKRAMMKDAYFGRS